MFHPVVFYFGESGITLGFSDEKHHVYERLFGIKNSEYMKYKYKRNPVNIFQDDSSAFIPVL